MVGTPAPLLPHRPPDDREDSAADAVSWAEHLYIWSAGTFTRYNIVRPPPPPLVPAEECLDLTRPCGGNGTSRTRSRRAASPPCPPRLPRRPPPALTEEAEQMVLDYFTSGRFRPVSGRAWFLGDGLSPRPATW